VRFWHDTRLLNLLANALIGLALTSLLAAGGWWLVHRPGHELHRVTIDPMAGTELRHVSSLLLGQAVRQRLKGNFFTVDLDAVRAGFEQVPWVRRATVRRVWPNGLAVAIEEHRPLALWGDAGLLNTFGEVYTANLAEAEEEGDLPHFAGPPGSQQRVLTRYEELRRWVAPLGRTPQTLVLSARYAWAAQLDDGTRLMLGRDQGLPIEERVVRWVSAYPRVSARLSERVQVVDLRYPNGFAVRAIGGAAATSGQGDSASLRYSGGAALMAVLSE
jgi:cell division protein FtsQ